MICLRNSDGSSKTIFLHLVQANFERALSYRIVFFCLWPHCAQGIVISLPSNRFLDMVLAPLVVLTTPTKTARRVSRSGGQFLDCAGRCKDVADASPARKIQCHRVSQIFYQRWWRAPAWPYCPKCPPTNAGREN